MRVLTRVSGFALFAAVLLLPDWGLGARIAALLALGALCGLVEVGLDVVRENDR